MAFALNTPQREAKFYVDGPLMVLAGAGSGKTRVIVEKIAWLIESKQFAPHQIAAITFTNKAAKEMRERVESALGHAPEGLIISTFHALGLRFLQQEHAQAGLKRGFSVLADDESRALIKDLAPKGIKPDTLNLFSALLSRAKNALQTPEQMLNLAKSPREIEVAKLYAAYQKRLKLLSALDFDDLIAMPVQLLRDQPAVRERWQHKLQYLLVDEYQDTNNAQFELLSLLAGDQGAFTAVGDDDQSIYAWRGANPENMHALSLLYPNLKVVKLEQNYRCSGRILQAANGLIEHNPHVHLKKLWSDRGYGDAIKVKPMQSEAQEYEWVAGDILNQQMIERSAYSEFAVLYRGNHLSRGMELSLRELGIPYQISGGTSLFDRQEIRDLLAHLRLLANPDDDVAFMRAIRAPKRDVGDTSLEKLAEASSIAKCSMLSACGRSSVLTALQPRAANALRDFARIQTQLQQQATARSPGELAEHAIQQLGYLEWLQLGSKDAAVVQRRKELLQEFIAWMKQFAKGRGLDALNAALIQISLSGKDDQNQNAVRLMTLHAAKGLEFNHVYIIGMDEGTFPHESALSEGRLEEERRLLYVGITRARKRLALCYPLFRTRYGEALRCDPSRFIAELPEQTLDADYQREGEAAISAAEDASKKLANNHLAALRALMSQ